MELNDLLYSSRPEEKYARRTNLCTHIMEGWTDGNRPRGRQAWR